MALSTHRASSSLAWAEPPPRWNYDIFLSFRGEDTRTGFVSHLYHELQYRQVFKTFKDDRVLELGDIISLELLRAIEQSHLAIVVLSPNYASSTWCLDELSKIIESMETESKRKRILPVFFNVEPSDVRNQTKSFDEAFAKHEAKFGKDSEKVKKWRAALREVAGLTGCDLKDKSESKLIEVIVKSVREKVLPTITLSDSGEKLVGIEFRLRQMGLLLAPEEKDVRFIGIWGMGGVGKTTLAELVYKRFAHDFDVAEFLDVRNNHGQLVNLQKQILFPVLKENVSQVWDVRRGKNFIRQCMSNKKVLLVVDDVDSCCDLLEKVAGDESWFGDASRIIVTTRDKRVLVENDIKLSVGLVGLNVHDALELFTHSAFKKDQPEEGFSELSKCFIDYAEGLPLALIILGKSLYKRDLETWRSALEILKRIPNRTILDSLKLSYDALDDLQQKIFLDIAFFYKGMEEGRVNQMLEYCNGFNCLFVTEVLIEKSLITIELRPDFIEMQYADRVGMHGWGHYKVEMHGLVQEMARRIVREESEEPGLRSRLCNRDDIFDVFTRNTGTDAIRGIRLCLPSLEEAGSSWNIESFSRMPKLMFLEFDNLIIGSDPKFLPNSLRILIWNWYPSESLPASFRPNSLGELKMQRSNLVRLWDERQDLPNLKCMDLSESKNLKETPDFTGIPNLEELNLTNCDSLVEVHPSIAVNKKLKRLILEQCKNVNSLPSKIEMDSLEVLNLAYCSKVKIPEFGEGMKNLSILLAPGTATEELTSSIEHLVGLTRLNISDSKSLQSLPGTAIFKLKSLEELCMGKCPKIVENTGETGCLKLRMSKGLFKRESPERACLALPCPRALPSLRWLDLHDCNLCRGVIPNDIVYCLPSLEGLNLAGNNFVSLPASIKCLSKLRFINLSRCKWLKQLPDLPSNERLAVWADNCDSLKMLSEPLQRVRFPKLQRFCLITVNCFGCQSGFNSEIFSMLRRLAAEGIPRYCFDDYTNLSFRSKICKWFDI
ncbi:putative TIR domain, winged helix-turn-helix DNA-binding domain-containing protein [Rosa chinensis]|uniref:Putative TIR domain, winged helix-turn-helix DNA-binding domain-containing protein n=1 Tax=Rosa chinensis TaxID=74649 RepID=A0A2P6QIS2_ROSCH|nr:TMV resistance protein N [Rosa chinensis]PRQ34068.1 putative TIR domain, winged helix-turn-helix DNA-binding domain-containing protein [Rosa chinensis]